MEAVLRWVNENDLPYGDLVRELMDEIEANAPAVELQRAAERELPKL